MKYIIITLFLALLPSAFAQDYSQYKIDNINISTTRVKPSVAANKFTLKKGDVFDTKKYDKAQDDLHNTRLFKELNFTLTPKADNKLDINIDGKDGYFIFPLFFAMGGAKSAAAISLMEGNYFKQGETAFIFSGFSKDGVSVNTGLAIGDSFFSISFLKLNFDQRFYADAWSSNYGIFAAADDKDKYGNPAWQTNTKQTNTTLVYAYKPNLITYSIVPQFRRVSYPNDTLDSGVHNNITFAMSISDNMPRGDNMGAIFGYGLSDKQKALQNLPAVKYGYRLAAHYTNGGTWTGSDYEINKFGAALALRTELKNRHLIMFTLKVQEAVKAPFSDSIRSVDLLAGFGRYNRQILGARGIGFGAAFSYYLLRNNTGLLALEPFYELAYIYEDRYFNRPLNQSGTGATLSYKFWRFAFPLGLNYTYNLSDSTNKVSFFIGGAF